MNTMGAKFGVNQSTACGTKLRDIARDQSISGCQCLMDEQGNAAIVVRANDVSSVLYDFLAFLNDL